jgi:hypothetical protein
VGSPLAEFRFRTSPHILPRHTRRLPGEDAAGASLDFFRPRSFYFGGVFGLRIVETGEELRGYISSLANRQCQRFT